MTRNIVFLVFLTAATQAFGDVFTWTGNTSTDWDNSGNWTKVGFSMRNWPDHATDIAKIDSSPTAGRYPIIDSGAGTIDVATFTCTVGSLTDVVLEVDEDADLVIHDENGLNFKNTLKLDKSSQLLIADNGAFTGGTILFTGAVSTATWPVLRIGDGVTVVASGAGKLVSDNQYGGAIRGEVGATPEAFVLGPNYEIRGPIIIDVNFANMGNVHTQVDEADSSNNFAVTTQLACHPKIGAGNWFVDGGTGSYPATLKIDASLVGSGNLTVYNDGVVEVNRLTSLYGTFKLYRGGKVEVAKNILFEVDRIKSTCELYASQE